MFGEDNKGVDVDSMERGLNVSSKTAPEDNGYYNPSYNNMNPDERLVKSVKDFNSFMDRADLELSKTGINHSLKSAHTPDVVQKTDVDYGQRLIDAAEALYSIDLDESVFIEGSKPKGK